YFFFQAEDGIRDLIVTGVQTCALPIFVGGAFPYGARRAIAYGDGWMPHARRPEYGDVIKLLPDFKKLAAESGRDPATLPITIFEIGRASCRERVCISVVGVVLKKKDRT